MNKYVGFVSDKEFLECVSHVVDFYFQNNEDNSPISVLKESKNDIDAIKTIFDISVKQIGFDGWANKEIERQQDKTINNKIGEFHQELLGKVEGWVDLGVGDSTEIDLKKEDNSIFVEIKNKHNTLNSSSMKICRQKLENVIEEYPDSTAYWAYIIGKKYKSENRVWKYQGRENEKIRRISGDYLYKIVTGNSSSLEKVYEAIPNAVVDLLGEDYKLSTYDERIVKEFQEYIYKKLD